MKSSKIENILNYNSHSEDKALSPFTYYQPFQSSFDPGFFFPTQKATMWSDAPQSSTWGQGPESSPGGPSTSGEGVTPAWDVPAGSTFQPTASLIQNVPTDCFSVASTSGWKEPEGRSLCNSTWRNPAFAKPSFCELEDGQKYVTSSVGRLATRSPLPSFGEGFGGGPGGARFEGSSSRTKGAFGQSNRQPVGNQSFPFVFKSTARNVNQHFFKSGHSRPMICNFCRNNKEVPDIYLNHYLYDPETKKLSCPVLRKHVCEVCGGTGDQAHTLQYCPLNRERGLQSKVPVLLKTRTITNSTGKIRRN